MTATITATEAARQSNVTVATIRTWCRNGILNAVKVGGRWVISVLRPARRPTDRLRKGANVAVKTGRPARTRIGSAMSPARRYAVLDAHVARVNAGQVTTAQYLTEVVGADAAFVASYASPFGKAVAKVYREQYGQEPSKSGLVRRGLMLLPVFAYGTDELPVLDKGARNYARTALLLAA